MIEVLLGGLPCAVCGHPAIAFVPAVGTRHPGSVCRIDERADTSSDGRREQPDACGLRVPAVSAISATAM
ncbi:hypothetical protein [Amycolatopsis sp. NPDC051372]|uniref:hypothetical protein n=1 Tax=Amycolatopsis sp. NPDC051372 TaxID=3155669 RepID=UPI003437A76A